MTSSTLAVGVATLLYMFTKPNIYQATAVTGEGRRLADSRVSATLPPHPRSEFLR
jgi:uncharacterized protein involved in exopolysaccharide biosynthesis